MASEVVQVAPFTYEDAFSRNIGLLTVEEQDKLRKTCVAIAGCGGAGGGYASSLARAGIGGFVLADHDHYECVNFNRQYGATTDTLGRNKAVVTGEIVKSINPESSVKVMQAKIDESNVDEFLEGVHAVMDSLDFFAPNARRLVYRKAYEKGIPVFAAAPVGWSCAWEIFLPTGPSLEEFCRFTPDMTEEEVLIHHIVSVAPAGLHLKYMKPKGIDFTNHAVPSLGPALTISHGILVCEVVNYVIKKRPVYGVPHYAQIDVQTLKFKRGYLRWGNGNPIQRLKIWYVKRLLEKGKKERAEREKTEKK